MYQFALTMKKIHIIGIILTLLGIVVFTQSSKDVSTYATFSVAQQGDKKVKVGGQLIKEKDITYNPDVNPYLTTFYMTDGDGEERKVILSMAKPQDFELSEQVVVTGKMEGEVFMADEILVKCPSKYKTEEIYLKEEATS